jgi:TPR repeat protein
MQRLILLALFSIQLIGCQQLTTFKEEFFPTTSQTETEEKLVTPVKEAPPSELEVQKLLRQKQIDPLTKYIEIHQNNKNQFDNVQMVRIERDKRCAQIAKRYQKMEKTAENLNQLREGYNYSCPRVVSDFAATVLTDKPSSEALPKNPMVSDVEVKKLLRQKRIDPLTQYIEKHQNNPEKAEQVSVVRAERDKRCGHVEKEYAKKDKNHNHLTRLTKGYQYSCPAVVKDFAAKLPGDSANALAVTTTSTGPLPENNGTVDETQEALNACETALKQQEFNVAFTRCKPLAEQGNASIQYKLGLMYEEGKGVEKDLAMALQWLQRAAEQNFSKAQLLIGRKYYTGAGVPRDLTKAAEWYRLAAEQNDAEAQYILGIMYELGQGVPQDFVLAYQFFLLSAAQGHTAATTSRGEMDTKLSPEQVAEGQRLAREWSEKYTSKK